MGAHRPPSHDEALTDVRTIGDTLREQRVRRGQSPAEAARDAGVPADMLAGLEAGTLSSEDVTTRAFLRMYARYLDLDAEALLGHLEAAAGAPPAAGAEGGLVADAPAGRPRRRRRRVVVAVLVVLLLAVAAGVAAMVVLGTGRLPSVRLIAPAAPAGDEGSGAAGGEAEPAPLGSEATGDADQPPTAAPPGDIDEVEGRDRTDDAGTPADGEEPGDADQLTARPPEDTRVQVLHNDAAPAVIADVRAVLEALGYPVVQVNAARTPFDRTTVYYVDGWQAEAEALAVHDERFAAVEPNERFSSDVDLHVAVGPDWPAGE